MNRSEAAESAHVAGAVLRKLTRTTDDRYLTKVQSRHPAETLALIERAAPGALDDRQLMEGLLVEFAELAAGAAILATVGAADRVGAAWSANVWRQIDALTDARIELLEQAAS